MKRHRYARDLRYDAICVTCGQGRSERVHDLLVWKKAPSGNWVTTGLESRGTLYRCRKSGRQWLPELGANPDWLSLAGAMSLAEAQRHCERHRELNEVGR